MTAIYQPHALIAHLDIPALHEHGEARWQLIAVDLERGRQGLAAVAAAKQYTSLKPADKFAVSPRLTVVPVEPAGASTPPPSPSVESDAPAVDTTPTLEELGRRYDAMSAADKARVIIPEDKRSDAAFIASVLDSIEHFHDVTSQPVARPPLPPAPTVTAHVVDEGETVDDQELDALVAAFNDLDDAAAAWVSDVGSDVRCHPASGGVASERRVNIVAGLVTLAGAGHDDHDKLRAVLAVCIGDDALKLGIPVHRLVDALHDVGMSDRFVGLCGLIAVSDDPFAATPTGTTLAAPLAAA